jgi:hypothetical protein
VLSGATLVFAAMRGDGRTGKNHDMTRKAWPRYVGKSADRDTINDIAGVPRVGHVAAWVLWSYNFEGLGRGIFHDAHVHFCLSPP